MIYQYSRAVWVYVYAGSCVTIFDNAQLTTEQDGRETWNSDANRQKLPGGIQLQEQHQQTVPRVTAIELKHDWLKSDNQKMDKK